MWVHRSSNWKRIISNQKEYLCVFFYYHSNWSTILSTWRINEFRTLFFEKFDCKKWGRKNADRINNLFSSLHSNSDELKLKLSAWTFLTFISLRDLFLFCSFSNERKKKKQRNQSCSILYNALKGRIDGTAGRWPMWWYNEMHILFLLVFSLYPNLVLRPCVNLFFYLSISFSLSRSHCYSDYNLDLGINILRCLCTTPTNKPTIQMKSNGFSNKFKCFGHLFQFRRDLFISESSGLNFSVFFNWFFFLFVPNTDISSWF